MHCSATPRRRRRVRLEPLGLPARDRRSPRFPFLTHEILALDPAAVPLTLHNYTTFANVLAFLLLGALDLVTVFNVITIASGVMAAYAMFLFARGAPATPAPRSSAACCSDSVPS